MTRNINFTIGIAFYSILISTCIASSATYTVTGTIEFKHDTNTSIKDIGTNTSDGKIPFPINTHINFVTADGDNLVKRGMAVNDDGLYSITVTVDPTTAYKLKVHLETIKDLTNNYKRVNVNGITPLEQDWWFRTNSFKFQDADPNTNTLMLDLFVGNESDSDVPISSGAGTMREMYVKNGVSSNYDEDEVAKLATTLLLVDTAYREIDASGKIPWLGTRHDADEHGQMVFCPPNLESSFSFGICWPTSFDIFLQPSALNYLTVIHEFGHSVCWYTTSWELSDLIAEMWDKHEFDKETDTKIAFAEGWANYFEAAFAETHDTLVYDTYTSLSAVEDSSGLYKDIWKGQDNNGTDNSGEIVEGAVAQVMWGSDASSSTFTSKIEPVWAILREGATSLSSRNSRKTFEAFYDMWMTQYSGSANAATRQKLRDACDTRGIVYSRMKMTKIDPIYTTGQPANFINIENKKWVSAISKFKAEQMDDSSSELNCSDVDEVVRKVKFDVSSLSSSLPFSWLASPPSGTTGISDPNDAGPWNNFANNASSPFEGELNAGTASLSNKYYLVRARVDEDGTVSPETFVSDNLKGPLLGTSDASNKTTARWWNDLGIFYQIKVDKVSPQIDSSGRFPPAN